jgi:hypothetical protein
MERGCARLRLRSLNQEIICLDTTTAAEGIFIGGQVAAESRILSATRFTSFRFRVRNRHNRRLLSHFRACQVQNVPGMKKQASYRRNYPQDWRLEVACPFWPGVFNTRSDRAATRLGLKPTGVTGSRRLLLTLILPHACSHSGSGSFQTFVIGPEEGAGKTHLDAGLSGMNSELF